LSHISENDVYHGNKHSVSQGVTGILNNGDDVGAVSSHANQVTAGTVRELNGIDITGGTDNISNVRDGGTTGTTNVKDLHSRLDVDVVQTTQDTGSQLGTEGVPHTVLNLGDSTILVFFGTFNANPLLTIDGLARSQVLGDEQILLTTAGNEDTSVTVGLL
jgi:hypothetical protein